jgi:hypothetical protein
MARARLFLEALESRVLLDGGPGPTLPGNLPAAWLQAVSTPVAGDLTGDGLDDLAVLDAAGQILYRQALPGDGTTYAPPVVVNQADEPACAICLVHAGAQTYLAALDALTQGQRIVLYAYDPSDGAFTAFAGPDLTGTGATAMTAGDLTGDGRDDLVVVSPTLGEVLVFDQRGDGTFGATPDVTAAVGGAPTSVSLADICATAQPDIVTTDPSSGEVCVLLNTPDGQFSQQEQYWYAASGGPAAAVAAPVGEAAFTPVVLAAATTGSAGPQASLVVLTSDTPTAAAAGESLVLPGSSTLAVPAGSTVVVSGPMTTASTPGQNWLAVLDPATAQVWSYAPDDAGRMQLVGVQDAGNQPTGLSVQAVALPGGRERYDLLVGNAQGDILRLEGNGDGTFQPYRRVFDRVSLAADLAGPGVTDFIFANEGQDRVSVEDGSRRSVLGDPLSGMFAPSAVLLADLDGDGTPYLLVCNSGGDGVQVFPELGDGQFGPEVTGGGDFTTGDDPDALALLWLPGRALPEVLVANWGSDDVTVLGVIKTAAGCTLTTVGQFYAGDGPTSLLLADVGGTGQPDLIITDGNANQVRIVPVTPAGWFDAAAARVLPTGPDPMKALVGDFGDDGALGLVTLDTGGNDLTYYADIASPASTGRQINSGGEGPIDGLVRDVNGKSGLLVANYGDGQVSLFLPGAAGPTYAGGLESPGGHPTALAANPAGGDPWSVYVADAGSESAGALNFDELAGYSAPLLGAEPLTPYQPPERAAGASLQPLTETTVGLVPTLLAGEDAGRPEAEATAAALLPARPVPAAPAQVLAGNQSAGEAVAGVPADESADRQEPGFVEDPSLQRYLLGADATPTPAVRPDGSTQEPPAAGGPEKAGELPPARDPLARAPEATGERGGPTPGRSPGCPETGGAARPGHGGCVDDLALAAAILGLAWDWRRRASAGDRVLDGQDRSAAGRFPLPGRAGGA